MLEESFDARLTVRGDRIVIEGNAVEVQQLTALFADLFKTVEEGQAPDTDSVRRSVELLRQAEFAPTALRDDVLLTYRGRAIRPKTAGQKHYVDAIRDNTVTFAIGPAGTGKTYLAMAMAVAALKRKEVGRVVLSRPIVEAGENLGFLPAFCRAPSSRRWIPTSDRSTMRCTPCSIRSERMPSSRTAPSRSPLSPSCAGAP